MTTWRKSTFSNNGDCVELADIGPGLVGVRDSKHPNAGHLTFTRDKMRAFIEGVRAGEFDDLG